MAVLPIKALVPSGHHIFRGAVESLSQRFRLAGSIGPVSREYVVGPPAKQQVERRRKQLVDSLAACVVEEFGQPASQLEIAAPVFVWTAGCLHHAVERNENGSNYLTHRCPPHGSNRTRP